jgi:hypothetical protein
MGDRTAPLALPFLENWIDEMANTALWTGVQPDISAISNGTDTPLITLQQGANFGTSPVYSVAAFEDGTVVYTGIANVDTLGVQVLKPKRPRSPASRRLRKSWGISTGRTVMTSTS